MFLFHEGASPRAPRKAGRRECSTLHLKHNFHVIGPKWIPERDAGGHFAADCVPWMSESSSERGSNNISTSLCYAGRAEKMRNKICSRIVQISLWQLWTSSVNQAMKLS